MDDIVVGAFRLWVGRRGHRGHLCSSAGGLLDGDASANGRRGEVTLSRVRERLLVGEASEA